MECHQFEYVVSFQVDEISCWADNPGRLKRYLIDTRNATIRQTLDSLYRNRVPGNLFQVFCASNTEYWKHRYSPKDAAFPHLCLSGILAIRKHCISMVADRQLRVATKYIQDDIPALLEDIELWVQSGAGSVDAEQKAVIRETLSMLEARLNRVRNRSGMSIKHILILIGTNGKFFRY